MFKRRIGPNPHANGDGTPNSAGCPDIWELDNGEFAVIGRRADMLQSLLPNDASCGPDEQMVVIPRRTLINARADIPSN